MSGRKPGQVGESNLLNKDQAAALSQILGMDINQLIDPQLQQQFFQDQVAAPARQRFQEETIPDLSEEFINLGATRGSGFNRALTKAGSDLEMGLAGEQSRFMQQGQQNMMQLLMAALGRQAIQPIVDQGTNPLGDILGFGGQLAGGYIAGRAARPAGTPNTGGV